MPSQEELSRIFERAEDHRLNQALPVLGWGSNRHLDKDTLFDVRANIHWQRDHPDGTWEIVPELGTDHP
jgi:hypothetical protein